METPTELHLCYLCFPLEFFLCDVGWALTTVLPGILTRFCPYGSNIAGCELYCVWKHKDG